MSTSLIITLLCLLIVVTFASAFAKYVVRRKTPLDSQYFAEKWQDTQKLCSNKDTWPLAIIDADKLLDEALKKSHFKGKTMGERLVAAQRALSDNDGVWYGHKLRNRLVHENNVKLTQTQVRDALKGIRQALRDLGALQK